MRKRSTAKATDTLAGVVAFSALATMTVHSKYMKAARQHEASTVGKRPVAVERGQAQNRYQRRAVAAAKRQQKQLVLKKNR